MVDGKAPLHRFRGTIYFYVRERPLRTADLIQHQTRQREGNQIGMGPGAAALEGQIRGASIGPGPGVHGDDLRLPSPATRAEIYRAYLSRAGTDDVSRFAPGCRLVVPREIPLVFSLPENRPGR